MRLYQTAGGTPGTTRFAYDGSDLIGEYNSSNSLQRRFVHGPGMDEPIVWYEGSGTTDRRFLHADERGSVVAIGSGTGTSVNTYDEYGIPRSSNTGRFQYTGQTWLADLGVYYYKARIYSPTLGRFLQTDPIGYSAGMNSYAYVGSDSINGRDPKGLFAQCETGTRICSYQDGSGGSSGGGSAGGSGSGGGGGGGSDSSGAWYVWRTWYSDGSVVDSARYWKPDNVFDFLTHQSSAGTYGGGGGEGDEIVVTGSRIRGQPHSYRITVRTLCSAGEAFAAMKQPGMSAPGAPAAREGTHRVLLTFNNPIAQFVDTPSRTIINVTLQGHWFYPGSVTIQVSPLLTSGYRSQVDVTGTGEGTNPWINDLVGVGYFALVTQGLGDYCATQYGGMVMST